MKIEMITKTFEIEDTELIICKSENNYEIVGGYGNSIDLEESYTEKTLPAHFKAIFGLKENEQLCDTIRCVEVEDDTVYL